MIPKTIHYCWFGGKPLPSSAKHCIDSWKRFLPDYNIVEWNESNFDVNIIPYTRDAYKDKKYAHVSDYARFYILYHHGGVYFDTDVEVIKPMDSLISLGAFMGYEKRDYEHGGSHHVAPGLGIASEPKNPLWHSILKKYDSFPDFSLTYGSVCFILEDCFKEHGIAIDGQMQKTSLVTLYPAEYLCPKSFHDGKMEITPNTVSIHHYDMSWFGSYSKRETKLIWFFSRFTNNHRATSIAKAINNTLTCTVRKLRFWR